MGAAAISKKPASYATRFGMITYQKLETRNSPATTIVMRLFNRPSPRFSRRYGMSPEAASSAPRLHFAGIEARTSRVDAKPQVR